MRTLRQILIYPNLREEQLLAELLEAAVDQPNPTPELARVVNDILTRVRHVLAPQTPFVDLREWAPLPYIPTDPELIAAIWPEGVYCPSCDGKLTYLSGLLDGEVKYVCPNCGLQVTRFSREARRRISVAARS